MNESAKIRKKFDALYAEWQEVIQSPRIQASSNPHDYTNNEPYQAIVKLGKDVLPLVLEKVKEGVFFMNQAVLDITETDINELIEGESKLPTSKRIAFMKKEKPPFLSEQQKSEIILKYITGNYLDG
jgi:hypothetical protein